MAAEAGATYDVDIRLRKVGDGWSDLTSGVGKFSDMVDGAVSKVGRLAVAGVFVAGTTAIAGMTYGVASLNAEAEKAQISIGTIFSANGMANGVPAGIKMAGDTIAKMRVDAQKLPGEFDDLRNIFATGAISAFRSGASVDQWRQLSAKTMAASAVAVLPMDQAARELAQLLEGRSGAHNVLGMRLMGLGGQEAEKFNKMDSGKRLEMLSSTLEKYSGAIDAFGNSWEGLTSTAIDNAKSFMRSASEPLFGEVKNTFKDINKWFSDNQGTVEHWANHIGLTLKSAFQWGRSTIEEWFPVLQKFAGEAYDRFVSVWHDVQPAVQSIAAALKDALSDPNGTIDKLVHLGELYIAMKVGGGILGAASGTKADRVAAGVGVAGAGIAATTAGASGGKELAAAGAATAGGAAAGSSFGLLGIAVGAVTGSLTNAAAAYKNYAEVKAAADEHASQRAFKLGQSAWEAAQMVDSFAAKHGEAANSYAETVESWAARMEESGDETGAAFLRLNSAAIGAAAALDDMFGRGREKKDAEDGERWGKDLTLAMTQQSRDARAAEANGKKPGVRSPKGHGGTNVQKVEIVVTSNQSPSRIARAVEARLANLGNNRRVSPDVPNYSTIEKG